MKLTDKNAIRIYNNLKCGEVVDSIDNYPEDERNGRDDLQILADEISYWRSCYEESGHSLNDLLTEDKDARAEYKQLKYYSKQLRNKGYYSKW